ncbi:MAG: hypothetical protein IPM55_15530 [Acidobacteria bacterium]|nr:hypothetical protein [Acidobacteriota bacterium]
MKAPSYGSPVLPAKRNSRTPSSWRSRIDNNDAHSLWRMLNRLVTVHPLVRSALGSQQSSQPSSIIISIHDLTQDLYLLLMQKGRFKHYIDTQMADAEIEREIFHIELTNLLIGCLRRQRPENYRIVRRVSNVLESDPGFRRFKNSNGRHARYRQAADAVFGLRDWGNDKKMIDSGTFAHRIASIPMRMRNRRKAGCTGDAQVIVSNHDLVELLVEIFEAIDSPAPLRILRQLALSKLPVYDPVMTSIDEDSSDEGYSRISHSTFASSDANPEDVIISEEEEQQARHMAEAFLDQLSILMRGNPRRTERLCRVLWHCYFDPDEPSQLEVAEMAGISDSSVSDYRRKLEAEMKSLDFAPSQLRSFAEELDELLRWRLSLPEKGQQSSEMDADIQWPKYQHKQQRTSKTILIN